MNKVELMGRLTRDPDIHFTEGEEPLMIARYTLAVERRKKKDDDTASADFISCVAFGRNAEFVQNYLHKGIKIVVCGRIQTGDYVNKEGQKVYTTTVVAEEHEFAESKNANTNWPPSAPEDGFIDIPDDIDAELPFK